jgi:hypothetical protein
MNTNRTFAALATVTTLVTIGVGAFLFSSSTGSGNTAPADPTTAQEITITARHTNQAPLGGVAIQVNGAGKTKVVSGTTNRDGEIALSFDPEPGTYIVTATEPTGYRAQNDKDGKVSQKVGPMCQSVYLCIYLTATEVQDNAGNKTVVLTLTHVRKDQMSRLDDLWFEMEGPTAAEEETSFIDPADDEILIGEPVSETDDTDETTAGEVPSNDILQAEPVDEVTLDEVVLTAMTKICVNAQHQPVAVPDSNSAMQVRGNVTGVDKGVIVVQGPTINNGDPVQITVENGQFDGPLGINQYGDHPIERFELQSSDPAVAPTDLISTLNMGPGTIFPVDSSEGALFETECFDFDAPATEATDAQPTAAPEQTADEQATQALTEAHVEVQAFLNGFVEDHTTGDAAGLIKTLHPAISLAFGADICSEYVTRTTGSITGATVLAVDLPQSINMDTPNGPITFTDAIPFTVEFSLVDGTTLVNDANLAQHDGVSHWLTRCGVDG